MIKDQFKMGGVAGRGGARCQMESRTPIVNLAGGYGAGAGRFVDKIERRLSFTVDLERGGVVLFGALKRHGWTHLNWCNPNGGMDDEIHRVYFARNEALVREHAQESGSPVNRVSDVKWMIDPTASEA